MIKEMNTNILFKDGKEFDEFQQMLNLDEQKEVFLKYCISEFLKNYIFENKLTVFDFVQEKGWNENHKIKFIAYVCDKVSNYTNKEFQEICDMGFNDVD